MFNCFGENGLVFVVFLILILLIISFDN